MSAPDTYCDLLPLPDPDTHCFDEDTKSDVWSHSADQMHAYARAASAASSAKLPRTPEEVIEFIGPHFDALHSVGAKVNWRYKLSVHDLLHAFNELKE